MEDKKYPIGGFAPGNYTCKCVSCKENFMGDKRAVQCEDCAKKENKPYWKSLKEKYEIPLNGELMDEEVFKWYKKDREQANYLIEKYGSCAWRINELANTLRNEEISESHFRELVRYCLNEHFKETADKKIKDKINALKSKLAEEKRQKLTKTINQERVKELEIQIKILQELL